MNPRQKAILRLLSQKPQSIWELSTQTDLCMRELAEVLNTLYDEKYITTDGVTLTATKPVKPAPEPDWEKVREKLEQIDAKRPEMKDEFDQDNMNTNSAIERTRTFWQRGDLEDKEILCIGDDDLMSIALALTGLPRRVVALDIDGGLMDFINRVASEEKIPVEARTYTVEDPLPADLAGTFDAATSEPVETVPGFELFMSRAISGLKEDGVLYFGITHPMSSLGKWRTFQRFLADSGFALTDMVRHQALYEDKEGEQNDTEQYRLKDILHFDITNPPVQKGKGWFYTTLWRAVAVEPPKAKVTGKQVIDSALFADEEQVINCANPREGSKSEKPSNK